MKAIVATGVFLLALCKTPAQDIGWIGKADNAFATHLYSRLSATGGNLFFSPLSIETALVMTYAGAGGRTAEQMATVLHLPVGGEAVHKTLGVFLRELNAQETSAGKPRGYQLAVANALWGQQGFEFLPAFVQSLKADYGAGLNKVDFKTNSEGARQTINDWVAKETHDKIQGLIGPGMLRPDTRLVLTDAIYFKGKWAAQFDAKATQDKPFHVTPSREQSVPMMHRTGTYGYTEDNDMQALRLPYVGNELSMIILLPRKTDGLAALEKTLSVDKLTDWLSQFHEQKMDVSVPRFKVAAQFELSRALEAMGMNDAFSQSADFSRMTGTRDLALSNVIHKAFVEVNEEGSEAAAATGATMRTMAILKPVPPPVFRADHPFIYIIRHEKSGAILFMGRLVEAQN